MTNTQTNLPSDFLRQDVADKTLVLYCPKVGAPELVYFSTSLPLETDLVALRLSQQTSIPQAMLGEPAPLSLLPEAGKGWQGSPAMEIAASDRPTWAPRWSLDKVLSRDVGYQLFLSDNIAQLSVCLSLGLTQEGMFKQSLRVTNLGEGELDVQRLALTMPVPAHFTKRMSFYGR